MDNNDLFNQNNSNLGQGVNDLLTQGYNQPSQPAQPNSGGLYSNNFGQDAFALRESMQNNAPIRESAPVPPMPVQPQYSGAEQNPYTQQTAYSQPNSFTQPDYSNPGYSQVPPMPVYNAADEADVSVGEWVLSTILMLLPCVGVILLFTWAFGSNTAKSKQNWAKAMLIIMIVGFIISTVFVTTIGIAFVRELSRFMQAY